jgi:hypothetical protein
VSKGISMIRVVVSYRIPRLATPCVLTGAIGIAYEALGTDYHLCLGCVINYGVQYG